MAAFGEMQWLEMTFTTPFEFGGVPDGAATLVEISEEVVIRDVAILEKLSEARNGDGVHVYLDVPLATPGLKLGTTLRDTQKGNVKEITYTALLRARTKDAKFALTIVDQVAYYALEVGLNQHDFKAYFDRSDAKKWLTNRTDTPNDFHLNEGDLVCIQMTSPDQKDFTATINNMMMPMTLGFAKTDLNHLWRYVEHHATVWTGIEVLEHHFIYTNITETLEPNPATMEVSLEEATLTQISIGGRAIITGSYVPKNANIPGISVDLQIRGGSKYTKILGMNIKTFSIAVGAKETLIDGDEESHTQNLPVKPTDFIYLIFQNIEITSMEFHSGLQALG
ncbi:uncharacterized protein LOC144147288 isoform X1 [Haemaphysalis longicornis]